MKNKVILVHGWKGNPDNHWFVWLKNELTKNNFEVASPKMDYEIKDVKLVISKIKETVSDGKDNLILVGHSLGCFAILKYLESLENRKIKGVILVAPWVDMRRKIDWNKIKNKSYNFVCIFSDNDEAVSEEIRNYIVSNLNCEVIIEKEKGHFDSYAGVKELQIVLDKVLEFSKK